jgi:glycerophosphoryl diester phosphodiesterase
MGQAIKNFTLSLFGILFFLGIGWILFTNHALSKPDPHPFPHPFLDALTQGPKPLVIAYRGLTSHAPPNTLEAFKAAAALGPKVILWVDARPTADGHWIAWTDRSLPENPRSWISYMHDDDVAKSDAGFDFSRDAGKTFPFRGQGFHIEKLETILKAFPNRMFVINLQEYEEGGKERIIKVIDDAKAGERALISSPEDGILRDLREAEPTWLFGTSRAQVTRLIMLSQLFLSASAPMRGDVFVWDPLIPLHRINERVWAEVERRKMKSVIAIDEDSGKEWTKRADAVVTSDPASFVTH